MMTPERRAGRPRFGTRRDDTLGSLTGRVGLSLAVPLLMWGCAKPPLTPQPGDLAAAVKLAERGEELVAEDELRDAERYYIASLRANPGQSSVWNNLGVVYLGQNNLLDARRAFSQAIETEPREVRPYVNLGLLWLEIDAAQSEQYFEQALRINSGSLEAMRGLVQARKRSNARASQDTLDLIQAALLYERDLEWRGFFRLERERLEAEMLGNRDRFDASGL
ncbi:MAG: tetratricopeptide repeat protein [Planctomycetota bacterium]